MAKTSKKHNLAALRIAEACDPGFHTTSIEQDLYTAIRTNEKLIYIIEKLRAGGDTRGLGQYLKNVTDINNALIYKYLTKNA